MAFPSNPNPGDTYTDTYGTVWVYAGSVNGWYRKEVIPGNETTYTGGGSGSATATGNAGEIQYTDGTNLAASPNLVWDNANDELEIGGDIILDDGGTFTTTIQCVTPTLTNKTISFPDATGTVALVAGSSGQLVYNNAGAQAGAAGSVVDSSGNVTIGGLATLAGSPSANNTSGVLINGTWRTGASSNNPQLLLNPTGTTLSTTWSTSGTGLGVNAASGFAGNLLDLQVNGTSQAKFTKEGTLAFGSSTAVTPSTAGVGNWVGTLGLFGSSGVLAATISGTNINISTTHSLDWGNDTRLFRDAADTVAQRRTTNAQTFRVYNTFTDASNYERGFLRWSSNVFEVGPEAAGTGTARPMRITAATLKLPNLPTYAAATTGGLVAGDVYKTATGELRITV
jgi:hypothetical protein